MKSGERKLKFCVLFLLSGAVVVLLALVGCAPALASELPAAPTPVVTATPTPVPTPMTLRVAVGREGPTLDPAYLQSLQPGDYMGHLFEGLMKYAPADGGETALVQGLAEAVEVSGDGRIYRFTLRADARWSDGVPVTAGDFVYAWQRLRQVGQSPGAALLWDVLESVTAEGDRVLAARLQRPCPWFLRLCAACYTVPLRQDLIARYGGDWTNEQHIVVSGAYTIADWVHDDRMVLVPNPCYYEAVGPQVIEWQFQGGEAQFTGEPGGEATYFMYINANSVPDWRVRAAMVLALDSPATGMVPDSDALYGWLKDRYVRYDLTAPEGRRQLAMDLMANARAAGSWHTGYRLYIRVRDDPWEQSQAEHCAARWRQVLGMEVQTVETADADYERALTSGSFHVAGLWLTPDYDDPTAWLQTFARGGADNHSGWGDVRYDKLLEEANAAMDPAARGALLDRAEQLLFSEGGFAVCPLQWRQPQYEAEGVTGVGHGFGGWRFQDATVWQIGNE